MSTSLLVGSGPGPVVVPEGSLPTPHAYMSYGLQGETLRLSFSRLPWCRGTPGDEWRGTAMRPIPRAVQLVGGATIALGEPLPESLETMPRRSGALTIIGQTGGLFGTTDSIAADEDSERDQPSRLPLLLVDHRCQTNENRAARAMTPATRLCPVPPRISRPAARWGCGHAPTRGCRSRTTWGCA